MLGKERKKQMGFFDKLFRRHAGNEGLYEQLKEELQTFIRKVQLDFIGYTFEYGDFTDRHKRAENFWRRIVEFGSKNAPSFLLRIDLWFVSTRSDTVPTVTVFYPRSFHSQYDRWMMVFSECPDGKFTWDDHYGTSYLAGILCGGININQSKWLNRTQDPVFADGIERTLSSVT